VDIDEAEFCSSSAALVVPQMILEDLEASRDPADFIGPVDERNVDREVALRQFVHCHAGSLERDDQAAAKPERNETGDCKPAQPGYPGPKHPAKNHSVDVVDVGARLKRQHFVSRTKGADIGEFSEFGATGRPGRQIFDKAAAGACGPHDVLDQELAGAVLELPAVDVDVFGIGMHVSDAGVSAARAVHTDIVRIFTPAHGADRSEGHLTRPIRLDLASLGFSLIVGENPCRGLYEVAYGGAALIQNRITQYQDLQGGGGKKDDRQRRNDHGKALIDGEITHPLVLPLVEDS